MIDTLLFDLDGTLAPFDTEQFIHHYISEISAAVAELMPPEQFVNILWSSTGHMIGNIDQQLTNQEAFFADFLPKMGYDRETLETVLNRFYDNQFAKLNRFFHFDDVPETVIRTAHDLGFDLVIATNPIFPRKAVMDRLRWVNIDQYPYRLITSYENMHFCKPHLQYYKEILININKFPHQCMMIGNDLGEDMIAKNLGMKTYWVKDFAITRVENGQLEPDYSGTLQDFLALLPELNAGLRQR